MVLRPVSALVVAGAGMLGAAPAIAQSPAFISQADGTVAGGAGDGLSDLVLESGMSGSEDVFLPPLSEDGGNWASILQQGNDNTSIIRQFGANNSAAVDIVSSNGNTTVQEQYGSRNRSGIRILRGGYNDVLMRQRGDDNSQSLVLEDSVGVELEIHQTGNGNAGDPVVLSSTGGSGPIIVEQSGR